MQEVLWISRHQMTREQAEDLHRILGGPFHLSQYENTVTDLHQLSQEIQSADIICAVLPPELLSQLLKMAPGTPVLRSVAGRVPTGHYHQFPDGRQEQEFSFVHRGWEQILKMEIETRML